MPEETKISHIPSSSAYLYDPSSITKSITAGLTIIDKDFRIVWMNKVLQEFFGPLSTLKGLHCYKVYERRGKVCPGCPTVKIFKHRLNECVSLRRNIIVNTGVAIEKRHFKLTATPIRDDKGDIIQVLEVVEDVTDEVRIKEEVNKHLHLISREINIISRMDKEFICSEEWSLDRVLRQSTEMVSKLLGGKTCNLRLIDGSRKMLMTRASKGLSKSYIKSATLKIGEGIAGRVAATKRPIVIRDIFASGRKDIKFINEIKKEGLHSLMCVPIILQKAALGTLMVYDKKIGAFTKNDQRLLLNFANHVAILIDNIKAHKKVFIAYINTIKALVSAVEARDSYTRGHSEKVTKLALDIATAINLPKTDRIMLAYCGRLHDIGKIAISDSILNKHDRLTVAERAEIKMHPTKAVEILANLKFLEKGLPAIKHHHERYDGKGYPDGLKGNDIPLLARIIGCADAFDAMMSDRPYRPKMDIKKALTELKVNRKKQFDPDILDIFVNILQSKPQQTLG